MSWAESIGSLCYYHLFIISSNYSVTQPGLAWLGLGWAETITWFRLGKEPRVPFHLYFSNEEAEEIMKIAIRLEAATLVMMRLGIEVDIEKIQKLIENLTPNLQTGEIKGSLIFFQKLESESSDTDSEDGSTPSREEIKALHGST